jgi:hypothetical protein
MIRVSMKFYVFSLSLFKITNIFIIYLPLLEVCGKIRINELKIFITKKVIKSASLNLATFFDLQSANLLCFPVI